MDTQSLSEQVLCFHLERRVVARVRKDLPFGKRPDLVLWICHFPLPSASGIQCPVRAGKAGCPHNGPYGSN